MESRATRPVHLAAEERGRAGELGADWAAQRAGSALAAGRAAQLPDFRRRLAVGPRARLPRLLRLLLLLLHMPLLLSLLHAQSCARLVCEAYNFAAKPAARWPCGLPRLALAADLCVLNTEGPVTLFVGCFLARA
jgi:hypothetical protein